MCCTTQTHLFQCKHVRVAKATMKRESFQLLNAREEMEKKGTTAACVIDFVVARHYMIHLYDIIIRSIHTH